MAFFRSLISRDGATAEPSVPPGYRVYAIGDIHGRLDLLQAMYRHIVAELVVDKPADWRIIYLGDYVDRGPASKGVDIAYAPGHTTSDTLLPYPRCLTGITPASRSTASYRC